MKKSKADKKRQEPVVDTTQKKSSKTYVWLLLALIAVAIAGGLYFMQGSHDTVIAEDEVDETRATKKAGEDFLDANAKKEGVVTLPSGLQYKVITMGKGEKPKATDTVKAHYRGCLIDGTEFDSSTSHGTEPLEFPLSGVIRGWTEILQLMPVGSKWEVYIPQYLAYGERGTMGIPPYSALVFTIELVDIVK